MKPFLQFQKVANSFIFHAGLAIIAFIFVGNAIAYMSGITDQVSKIFYWEEKGSVAGEYAVRMAQVNTELTDFVDHFMSVHSDPTALTWEWREGVLMYGMWRAYQKTNDTNYSQYVRNYYDSYIDADGNISGTAAYPQDQAAPGIALTYLYQQTNEAKYRTAITNLADFVMNPANMDHSSVTAGGETLNCISVNSGKVSTDAVFMNAIFLVRAGSILNNNSYTEEGINQTLCRTRTIQPVSGLFYHFYDAPASQSNDVFWGRGDGWMAASLVDILSIIPGSHAHYNELMTSLNNLLAGAANNAVARRGSGIWYTVLDYDTTLCCDNAGSCSDTGAVTCDTRNYLETSGSSLFNYAYKKARNQGFATQYDTTISESSNGLLGFVDANNTLRSVSGSTGPSYGYYNYIRRTIGTSDNYVYGAGVYMLALAEGDAGGGVSGHPHVVARQADFDQIKQHIANNEQPWKIQYDALMASANGIGTNLSTWDSSDCGNFDTRKNKGDSGARQLITLNLACILSGDATVCTKAKNHLLGWTTQQNLDVIQCVSDQDSIHSVNSVILDAALSYDWLYNQFTSAEITQVSNWLSQAGLHVRSVHDSGSNRCHNKEAWDDATLAMVGLAVDNTDMVNYALGIGSYATSHQSIKSLIGCAIQDNGNVCDSVYHCNGEYSGGNDYLSHNMLLFEAIMLSSIGGAENGYENYLQTQPKLNAAFNFYGELFQANNLDNLDYAGADFTQPTRIGDFNWLYYTGLYEMGYKYFPSNINIINTLQDQDFNYYGSPTCTDCPAAPEYNQGVPRFCNQNNCSRWTKYPNLIWGQALGAAPAQTCAAQGGDICQPSDTCSGTWLSASNTNYCCNGTCQPGGGVDCTNCGAWANAGCNQDGCSGMVPMSQTRTGCPAGCPTQKCVYDASCGGPSCTSGSNCTTNQSCPGTYDSSCFCRDVAGDNCPAGGNNTGVSAKVKIADNARDPAIAVDKTGALHIVYETNCYLKNGRPLTCDMMYVKYICQNNQGVIDETSRQKIGTGSNARVAVDNQNNVQVAWDWPGISGREGVKYNRLVNGAPAWSDGRLLFASPGNVEKARIAVDSQNEVYVSFQNLPHVSFVHFPADATPSQFTTATNVDNNSDSDGKGVRQGGIAIDASDGVHFSWSHYPEGGYYRKYSNRTLSPVHQRVTQGLGEQATSDFTSINVNKANNEIVYAAQPGNVDNPSNPYYGHLWYKNLGTDVNNEKLSAYNFGSEVALIDDGDNLNVEVAVDTRNISYVTFAGSNLKLAIEEDVDEYGIPLVHSCGDNICQWEWESFEPNVSGMEYCPNDCGHYGYYFTVDQSGTYSGEAAFRLTPGTVNNNQGGKKTNPIPAAARNQGVYVVFEDNAENINYNAYLVSIDGADVCWQPPTMKADFNCDGKVDVQDFGILLSHWDKKTADDIKKYKNSNCADIKTLDIAPDDPDTTCIDGNGKIDSNDFAALLGCWGNNNSSVCYGELACP